MPLQTLTSGDATRLEVAQPEAAIDSLRKLLGLVEPDFPDGRVALYVCGECGDYGCGATTVRVTFGADEVVWDDFGWQTNYDPVVVQGEVQRCFTFRRGEYERTLGDVLERFRGSSRGDEHGQQSR